LELVGEFEKVKSSDFGSSGSPVVDTRYSVPL
jgi:hypothetical protein